MSHWVVAIGPVGVIGALTTIHRAREVTGCSDSGSKSSGDGDGGAIGDGDSCQTGNEGCACYANKTCNEDLQCLSKLRVDAGGTGDGGESNSGDGDGDLSSGDGDGDSSSGDGDGDSSTGGDGDSSSGDGDGDSSTGGDGDGDALDACKNAAANVIDNFASCDENICNVDGRSGSWYNYADTLVNDSFKVGVPGGLWGDQSCAAVATGGSDEISHVGYAGIGIILADGEPYDLSGYTGLRLSIETDDDVQVIIKTATGGLFGAWFAGNTNSSSLSRDVSFASMSALVGSVGSKTLNAITELQFNADDPTAYGFAVHRVTLY